MPGYGDIAPGELKRRLDRGELPVLLDVREPWEFALSRIEGSLLLPMSAGPSRLGDLDPAAETVVICHHGVRSIQVAQFLSRSGFGNVLNLEGGLDAYSDVDPSVPQY